MSLTLETHILADVSSAATLTCPRCEAQVELDQLMANFFRCWSFRRWVLCHCPECDGLVNLQFGYQRISIGPIEDSPVPRFEATSSVELPDLKAKWSANGGSIKLDDKRWSVRASDP